MPAPTITEPPELPTFPSGPGLPDQPGVFIPKLLAFLAWFTTFRAYLVDLIAYLEGLTVDSGESGGDFGDMFAANNLSDLANPVAAGANIKPLEYLTIALSDEATALTTGNKKASWGFGYDFTITEIYTMLGNTNSSSGAVTVDVNKNGTTILSTKPSIDSGESTSLTGTAAVISVATSTKGDIFTADLDAAGTGAKGLKLIVIGHRT